MLLLFPHVKKTWFCTVNLLSSVGIRWGRFLWLNYSLPVLPKPAFASHIFSGLSETSPLPSLITKKNNSLQMLTLRWFLLYFSGKPQKVLFFWHSFKKQRWGRFCLQRKQLLKSLLYPQTGKKRQKLYFFRAFLHHLSPRVTNLTSESIHVPIRQVQKSD